MKTKVLVTACGASGGVGVVKALCRQPDIELVLSDMHWLNSGFGILPQAHRYVIPGGDHPGFADAVFKIAVKEKINIVFPIADEEVLALAADAERFKTAQIKVIMSPRATLDFATDKEKLTRRAMQLGIPCPKLLTKSEALAELKRGRSVVAKPTQARGGQGVTIAKTAQELEEGLGYGGASKKTMMIQEYVPGGTGSIHVVGVLLDPASQVKATFACHSLKTKQSHGGPAIAGEPVDAPELVQTAVRLLEATGPWCGPVNVEFKRDDRDGVHKLFEINPRIWGYNYLATAAGINFPELAVRAFRGEAIQPVHTYQRDIAFVRCTEDKIFKRADLTVHEI